jgi:sugar/nucleoside kinase (ribokinase family)
MVDVVIVGSVALDSIETPHGSAERALGGAATYASIAASYFAQPGVVGVVGGDFPKKHIKALCKRGVDLEGLEIIADGKTFFWRGRYEANLNDRTTLDTQLNVFQTFSPKLPASYRERPFLLLGNIHPDLQLKVLDQVERPRLVLCDTMNLWIEKAPGTLRRLLRRIDVLCVNDSEARQLSGCASVPAAAEWLLAAGPTRVVVKRGEHGCSLFSQRGFFSIPAYPVRRPVDPTGAGDTFAGGFLGHLASCSHPDETTVHQALVVGSAMASFCVEGFSVGAMLKLKQSDVAARCRDLHRATQFEPIHFARWLA